MYERDGKCTETTNFQRGFHNSLENSETKNLPIVPPGDSSVAPPHGDPSEWQKGLAVRLKQKQRNAVALSFPFSCHSGRSGNLLIFPCAGKGPAGSISATEWDQTRTPHLRECPAGYPEVFSSLVESLRAFPSIPLLCCSCRRLQSSADRLPVS